MTLYDRLIELKDASYRTFQMKLVPNIPSETILGVRTHQMRALAKEMFENDEREAFLSSLPHQYYEENLIHFFVLAMIKDFDECVRNVEGFLPYVDCWPVSDQATPKAFRKNHEKPLPYIETWISSEHVYTARFGLRMLMNEFLGDGFIQEYLDLAASNKGTDIYLQMMVAWFFATALAKRYDKTLPFFEERLLDEWIHKKSDSESSGKLQDNGCPQGISTISEIDRKSYIQQKMRKPVFRLAYLYLEHAYFLSARSSSSFLFQPSDTDISQRRLLTASETLS